MGSSQSQKVAIRNDENSGYKDEIDIPINVDIIKNDTSFHFQSYDLIQYCTNLHTSGDYREQCSAEVVPGFQYCQECMSQVSEMDHKTELMYLVLKKKSYEINTRFQNLT